MSSSYEDPIYQLKEIVAKLQTKDSEITNLQASLCNNPESTFLFEKIDRALEKKKQLVSELFEIASKLKMQI